jgi:hypothetical protein
MTRNGTKIVKQVFPNIYLWTTYGLVSLLERVWTIHKDDIIAKGKGPMSKKVPSISPYLVEVVAMVERALAMAYTGDARVITKNLMEPFGLKHSLIELGLPSITKAINLNNSLSKSFPHREQWPLTASGEPAVASKKSLILTFGNDQYTVSDI